MVSASARNRASVIEFQGELYFFYHRGDGNEGGEIQIR